MLSEISWDDLKHLGYSLSISNLDNWKSTVYYGSTSATVTTKSGCGMAKNCPFVSRAFYLGGNKDNSTSTANQYDRCVNTQLEFNND